MVLRALRKTLAAFQFVFLLADSTSAQLTPEQLAIGKNRVPVPIDSHNDRLFVTVGFSTFQYRFLLDKGALTALSQSLANHHQLDDSERIRITDSNYKKQKMGFTYIPELKLVELTIAELPATIFPDNHPLFDCLGIEGILGANAFSRTTLEINTAKQFLSVTMSHSDELPSILKLNSQNSPYLVTHPGGSEVTFFFDSGSSRQTELPKAEEPFYRSCTVKRHPRLGNSRIRKNGVHYPLRD